MDSFAGLDVSVKETSRLASMAPWPYVSWMNLRRAEPEQRSRGEPTLSPRSRQALARRDCSMKGSASLTHDFRSSFIPAPLSFTERP